VEHEPDDDPPLLRSTRLPPVTAPAPPSSLEDQGTRRQELRAALEELKADLDGRPATAVPPAPAPAAVPAPLPDRTPAAASPARASAGAGNLGDPGRLPGPRLLPGRRLALVALAVVAVLAGATVLVRAVAWSVAGAQDAAGSSASDRGSTAAPPPSPSAAATPPTPAPAATPGPSASLPPARPAVLPPPGLPRSGPGADAPGAELTAVVGRGGTVVVYERLVVGPGTRSVHLGPTPVQTLPAGFRGAGANVSDLQVAVDGRGVTPRGDGPAWQVSRGDGAPFTQLALRYRLAGALVRVNPAPPGRATIVLRPLTGPEASRAQDPVVVRLLDARVGQVYCPAAPQPLCDSGSGALHVATVPAGARPVVLAQLTLP
jgi:hypothetical protein